MSPGHSGRGSERGSAARSGLGAHLRASGDDVKSLSSWSAAIWRDSPSWLVSGVLHLSAMILFGAVYFRDELVEITQITAAWAVADQSPEDGQHALDSHLSLTDPATATKAQARSAAEKRPAAAIESPMPGSSAGNGDVTIGGAAIAPAAKPDRPPSPQPISLASSPRAAAAAIQPAAPRDGSAKVSSPRSPQVARYERLEQSGDDGAVERFTLADIGKYTGRQGEAAKAEFERLGADAIPALVRGLNRSAKIAHSCPVAEIYRKLDRLLAETDDPYLLLYALENTGRGVHPRAEHWQQIIAARNAWQKKYGERVAELRKQLDTDLHPKRALEAGRPLSEADADELALAVTHPDARRREEALSTIAKRGMTFGDADRYAISQPLISQLEDSDAGLRHAARQTLIALSGGREIGPSEEALDRDPAGAAVWWRDRWTQYVLAQTLARGRSSLLVEALGSSTRRDRVEALEELIERRPVLSVKQRVQAGRACVAMLGDSEAEAQNLARAALRSLAVGTEVDAAAAGGEVKAWNEYWYEIELRQVFEPQAVSLLNLARSLDERGSRDGAKRYYERIVREFPRTSAAGLAKERLAQ